MRETDWRVTVDRVLRPSRHELARCERAAEEHLLGRKAAAEQRSRRLAACEARIERARAAVFAEGDGVVSGLMTALEREWRALAKTDPEAGLMDLWAKIAPPAWLDQKRWRDSAPAARVDAGVALAADPVGVEAAEAAVDALRTALAPWGVVLGARTTWRATEPASVVADLLAAPLAAATEALTRRADVRSIVVVARAEARGEQVRALVDAHVAAHPALEPHAGIARELAHAAFVQEIWKAAKLDAADPIAPLVALWQTGYALVRADAAGVVLGFPST